MFNQSELNQLYQFACSLTNQSEQAYDLVHDAIIKLQKYSPVNPMSYCKTIIRNLFYDQFKRESRFEGESEVEELVSQEMMEEITLNKITAGELLSKISPEERELLFLWSVEERTFKEISELLDVKLGTLLSRVSRLRKKILDMESEND